MNLMRIIYGIRRRVTYALRLSAFYVKKPFWNISYNNNGNLFCCDGVLLNTSVKLIGNNNRIIIQGGVKLLDAEIMVCGSNNSLIIQEGTQVRKGGRLWAENENNHISIGRGADIGENFFVTARDYNTNITIGDGCLFSADVIIRNSDAHSILDSDGKRTNPGQSVTIGDRVWIGYGANVLKGACIGDDCIIGTQSVVSRLQSPPNSIIAGNPARVVKQGVHWDKARIK